MNAFDRRGDNLLFLISMPRSGSTLLQRLLTQHSQIFSAPEPWVCLHPCYALKSTGVRAEYDAEIAFAARRKFLELAGGEENYLEGVRRMLNTLYASALAESGKQLFLDKTPRYYFIIPELVRLFPAARFVILKRHPLAVLNSILEYRGRRGLSLRMMLATDSRHDLLTAPFKLAECVVPPETRVSYVRYEDLVAAPEDILRDLCKAIELDYQPDMTHYQRPEKPEQFGDDKNIHRNDRPTAAYANQWQEAFKCRQLNILARGYLQDLGPAVMGGLGYSYDNAMSVLDSTSRMQLRPVVSYKLLSKPLQERTFMERARIALIRWLAQNLPPRQV